MDKILLVIKNKRFWGYILTSAGSFLAGTGDLITFLTNIIAWFD